MASVAITDHDDPGGASSDGPSLTAEKYDPTRLTSQDHTIQRRRRDRSKKTGPIDRTELAYDSLQHAFFSLRIVALDYYMASPRPGFDHDHTPLRKHRRYRQLQEIDPWEVYRASDQRSFKNFCYGGVVSPDPELGGSSHTRRSVPEVPIHRIFGRTPAGQSCLLHLHGSFPYLIILYHGPTGCEAEDHGSCHARCIHRAGNEAPCVRDYARRLAEGINRSLQASFKSNAVPDLDAVPAQTELQPEQNQDQLDPKTDTERMAPWQKLQAKQTDEPQQQPGKQSSPSIIRNVQQVQEHVFGVNLIRATPFYGYHDAGDSGVFWLRIALYNPSLLGRTSVLLLNGEIDGFQSMEEVRPPAQQNGGPGSGHQFQPHESHIPFHLALLIDYNLYGMNFVHLGDGRFRVTEREWEKLTERRKQTPHAQRVASILPDKTGVRAARRLPLSADGQQPQPPSSESEHNEQNESSSSNGTSYLSLVPHAGHWDVTSLSPLAVLRSILAERTSTTALELDATVEDVLNPLEIAPADVLRSQNQRTVPGQPASAGSSLVRSLAQLWEDENLRRRERGDTTAEVDVLGEALRAAKDAEPRCYGRSEQTPVEERLYGELKRLVARDAERAETIVRNRPSSRHLTQKSSQTPTQQRRSQPTVSSEQEEANGKLSLLLGAATQASSSKSLASQAIDDENDDDDDIMGVRDNIEHAGTAEHIEERFMSIMQASSQPQHGVHDAVNARIPEHGPIMDDDEDAEGDAVLLSQREYENEEQETGKDDVEGGDLFFLIDQYDSPEELEREDNEGSRYRVSSLENEKSSSRSRLPDQVDGMIEDSSDDDDEEGAVDHNLRQGQIIHAIKLHRSAATTSSPSKARRQGRFRSDASKQKQNQRRRSSDSSGGGAPLTLMTTRPRPTLQQFADDLDDIVEGFDDDDDGPGHSKGGIDPVNTGMVVVGDSGDDEDNTQQFSKAPTQHFVQVEDERSFAPIIAERGLDDWSPGPLPRISKYVPPEMAGGTDQQAQNLRLHTSFIIEDSDPDSDRESQEKSQLQQHHAHTVRVTPMRKLDKRKTVIPAVINEEEEHGLDRDTKPPEREQAEHPQSQSPTQPPEDQQEPPMISAASPSHDHTAVTSLTASEGLPALTQDQQRLPSSPTATVSAPAQGVAFLSPPLMPGQVVFRPSRPPPSPRDVSATLEVYGLRHLEPNDLHYSAAADCPGRTVTYAGRSIRLRSRAIVDLSAFDSNGELRNIAESSATRGGNSVPTLAPLPQFPSTTMAALRRSERSVTRLAKGRAVGPALDILWLPEQATAAYTRRQERLVQNTQSILIPSLAAPNPSRLNEESRQTSSKAIPPRVSRRLLSLHHGRRHRSRLKRNRNEAEIDAEVDEEEVPTLPSTADSAPVHRPGALNVLSADDTATTADPEPQAYHRPLLQQPSSAKRLRSLAQITPARGIEAASVLASKDANASGAIGIEGPDSAKRKPRPAPFTRMQDDLQRELRRQRRQRRSKKALANADDAIVDESDENHLLNDGDEKDDGCNDVDDYPYTIDYRDLRALHGFQRIAWMAVEIFAKTRGDLLSDPAKDELCMISYAIYRDIPPFEDNDNDENEQPSDDHVERRHLNTDNGAAFRPRFKHHAQHRRIVQGVLMVNNENGETTEGTSEGQDLVTEHFLRNVSKRQFSPSAVTTPKPPDAGPQPHAATRSETQGTSTSTGMAQIVTFKTAPVHVACYSSETDMLRGLVSLIRVQDPDIITGYDVQHWSWGYILERSSVLGLDLIQALSRVPQDLQSSSLEPSKDEWGFRKQSSIHLAGRITLNLWRLMRSEVTLTIYSFEHVVHHVLQRRTPVYSSAQLRGWWDNRRTRHRVVEHFVLRNRGNMELLEELNIVGRTSELARMFGIDFFSVLSRGSQFRVESMMLRLAKPMNYIPMSPSKVQVSNMDAPEVIPLVMEPESRFYASPVLVMDFQSLYPSVMIAYNLCYSTCLGRLHGRTTDSIVQMHRAVPGPETRSGAGKAAAAKLSELNRYGAEAESKKMGAGTLSVPIGTIAALHEQSTPSHDADGLALPPSLSRSRHPSPGRDYDRDDEADRNLTVTPNGIVFVKQSVRIGVLPRMLDELLRTRIMVKASMKRIDLKAISTYGQSGDDILARGLHRMLNARQLGLKMISNVTYGYTSANYSGRMPSVDIADSIVMLGRQTLERAIGLVERNTKWGARVVYGDTDSLFILLDGKTREQAFQIGEEIQEAVTKSNPPPVTLKFEKVYHPCILMSKKRYVGNAYENPGQREPTFDAKGIETIRRDTCPATAKILGKSLRLLFSTADLSAVKSYVQKQMLRILEGRVNLRDFVFAKEIRPGTYKDPLHQPVCLVAAESSARDHRRTPRHGERIRYVVVYGPPGARLIDCVKRPEDLLSLVKRRVREMIMADEGGEHQSEAGPREERTSGQNKSAGTKIMVMGTRYNLHATYYITKQVLPALDRHLALAGVDVKEWFRELPRRRNVANSALQFGGAGGGSLGEEDNQTLAALHRNNDGESVATPMDKGPNFGAGAAAVDNHPGLAHAAQNLARRRHKRLEHYYRSSLCAMPDCNGLIVARNQRNMGSTSSRGSNVSGLALDVASQLLCKECLRDVQGSALRLIEAERGAEEEQHQLEAVCRNCSGLDVDPVPCLNMDCWILYERERNASDVQHSRRRRQTVMEALASL
eukprot:Clim_evm13s29 gene=Clim_evmTU13s29